MLSPAKRDKHLPDLREYKRVYILDVNGLGSTIALRAVTFESRMNCVFQAETIGLG